MIWVGIDPGKSGGVACLDENGKILWCQVMPDQNLGILAILRSLKIDDSFVSLEKAQPMRKKGQPQGLVSMFTYAEHFGIIQGLILAQSLKHELVPPRDWQKIMFRGTDTNLKPKERAEQAAYRLWPQYDFRSSHRAKKSHDGKIDALLIAEAARRRCQ